MTADTPASPEGKAETAQAPDLEGVIRELEATASVCDHGMVIKSSTLKDWAARLRSQGEAPQAPRAYWCEICKAFQGRDAGDGDVVCTVCALVIASYRDAKGVGERSEPSKSPNPNLLALLKRLEWAGYNGIDCCPECLTDKDALQHAPSCELSALIASLEAEPKWPTREEIAQLITNYEAIRQGRALRMADAILTRFAKTGRFIPPN